MNRLLLEGDFFKLAQFLPNDFADLLILDPPYNLTKNFNGNCFKKRSKESYALWFEKLVILLKPMLKNDATLYVCSDWKRSGSGCADSNMPGKPGKPRKMSGKSHDRKMPKIL